MLIVTVKVEHACLAVLRVLIELLLLEDLHRDGLGRARGLELLGSKDGHLALFLLARSHIGTSDGGPCKGCHEEGCNTGLHDDG